MQEIVKRKVARLQYQNHVIDELSVVARGHQQNNVGMFDLARRLTKVKTVSEFLLYFFLVNTHIPKVIWRKNESHRHGIDGLDM